MRIQSINHFVQSKNQNFNGILKLTKERSYNDNAQETTCEEKFYDYYPYKNETSEEIEKNIAELSEPIFDQKPYPTWNTYISKVITLRDSIDQYGHGVKVIDDVRPIDFYA